MPKSNKTPPVNTDEPVRRVEPLAVQPWCHGRCPMSAPVHSRCSSAARTVADIPDWVMEGG